MHISDAIPIAQHLKKKRSTDFRKILTENTPTLEQKNNKQKQQILEALNIRNIQPKLNRINFETSVNVLEWL